MMSVEQLRARVFQYIDANAGDTIELLRRLARTPGLSGSEGSADDPASVVGIIASTFGARGTTGHVQTVTEGSDNLIEVLGDDPERALLIEAHTDTVGVGDPALWHEGDPYGAFDGEVVYLGDGQAELHVGSSSYSARLRDQMTTIWDRRSEHRAPILYGRGVYDNKGSVVAMWAAIRALDEVLANAGLRLNGQVIGAYCTSEETDAAGARALAVGPDSWLATHGYVDASEGRPPRPVGELAAVVLEGSYGWTPVIGHRGGAQMLLTATGRSSHAATPQLGDNAVLTAARALVAIEDGLDDIVEELHAFLDPDLLGAATIAVGTTIVGGGVRQVTMNPGGIEVVREDVNAIPAWCQSSVDVRYPADRSYPHETHELPERLRSTIERFVRERLAPQDRDKVHLAHLTYDLPCVLGRTRDEAERHPLVVSTRTIAEGLLGYDPGLAIAPGSTDATFLAHGSGIPTLAETGPAGALSHQPHEFVEVDQLHIGAKVLAALALEQLGVLQVRPN